MSKTKEQIIEQSSGIAAVGIPESVETDDFDQKLAIEIIARFTGNSRGTPIAKASFIDGAQWAYSLKSVFSPPQAESDEDLWAELGNKINKHMEPLDDAFGIHPLLDLYGRSEFTITRKAKP